MPYLTPDEIPGDGYCRPLSIPASSEWLAIVSGALTELTFAWNWQEQGAVTVDEAITAMQSMIDAYYAGCTACTLPGGYPLLRLNPTTGAVEELLPDGTWGTPTGDYAIPPTPSRAEATAEERMCAAAANAANVLQTLYESLSDSFNSGLSYDAAVAAFVAAIAGAIGSVFGIVVTPLIVIFAILFGVVYATVEFVTADLWDSAFTEKLKCVLLSCATDDGDTVHFDMTCVLNALAHGTDIFDPTISEIRLFGQIYTILQMLGAQALDAAGATTAVTDADCSDCGAVWCRNSDFTASNLDGWTLLVGSASADGIVGAYGLQTYRPDIDSSSFPGYGVVIGIERTITIPVNSLQALFDFVGDAAHEDDFGWRFKFGAYNQKAEYPLGEHQVPLLTIESGTDVTGVMQLWIYYGFSGTPGTDMADVLLKYLRLNGVGENPIDTDNCFA